MIKDKSPQLIDVLTQTLKLSPLDKVKLVRQLASTLENNLVSVTITIDWAMQQLFRYRLSHGVAVMDCLIASVCHRL